MKHSQGKTPQSVKKADRDGFGIRLREAFDGATNAGISRKLGVSEAGVKNYIDGRIPPADMLIRIRALTNCSIDWLLTGEEPKEISGKTVIEEIPPQLKKQIELTVKPMLEELERQIAAKKLKG